MKNSSNTIFKNKTLKYPESFVITIGKNISKLNEIGYYYLSDSLFEKTKIKIPITDISFQNGSNNDITIKKEEENIANAKAINWVNDNVINSIQSQNISPNLNLIKVNEIVATVKGKENNKLRNFSENILQINKLVDITNTFTSTNVPFCSTWFNINTIHQIEKKANPEFFTDKLEHKTSDLYLEIRNKIINLYKNNTKIYLTSTGNDLFN